MDVRVPLPCVREEDLTPEEAAEILTSSSEYLDKVISVPPQIYYLWFHHIYSMVPPCKPKAGEAYLFKPDSIRCSSKFLCLWD